MGGSNQPYDDLEIFRRLLALARPHWGLLLGVLATGLLAAPLALLMPVPLKIAVDSVLSDAPLPRLLAAVLPAGVAGSKAALLWAAVGLQVAIVFLFHAQYLGSYVLQTYTGERLNLDFRARLFRHVQRLSFSFHDARGSADSIYRIQYDALSMERILVSGLIPFTGSMLTLAAMVWVMFSINVQLALIALAVMPVLFLLSHRYRVRMRPRYRSVKNRESGVLRIVQETMSSFRVVKAFGREEREEARFLDESGQTLREKTHLAFSEGALSLSVNVTTAVGTAAVLLVGVRSVLAGTVTLGELLMVIAYLGQLYGPLKTASRQVASLQSALASAARVFELMDEVPDVTDRPNARGVGRAAGRIEFRNVAFGYDGKELVLSDVNLHAPPGARVGIAGRTGAGKTTLVSLLPRFYDVTAGQILLDGVDVRDYRIADLRNQFSIVLQEPVLFSTTIEENIRYARPEATQEEVVAAARAANAHDFIAALPAGYGTLVGERGMRLSGGERQRISLARAFLKDAPILILDEPTSSVDTDTEGLIMEAMERLMKGRTTFMIAHRLGTLAGCDRRIEVTGGAVVDARAGERSGATA